MLGLYLGVSIENQNDFTTGMATWGEKIVLAGNI